MFDAFLSHSHKEKAFIEEIADKLEAHGISVWLDKRQIIPGDSFIDSIEKGMSLCHTCLIFYGKNTPNGWFKNEIESALIRIAYDKTFRVIPVLLPRANETNVNNFVKALHWVKFTKKNDDEAFFTLLKGIRRESPGKYISRDSLSILKNIIPVKPSDSIIQSSLYPSVTLNQDEIDILDKIGTKVIYKKGQTIIAPGTETSQILFVTSGLVSVYGLSRFERKRIVCILKSGLFVDLASAFSSDTYRFYADSLEDTEVILINKKEFLGIIESNKTLNLKIKYVLCQENLQLYSKLVEISEKQMAGKVAFMLLYFSEYVYGDTSFEFPLSMTDLSDFLNCSRETLSRTINAFAADKIIDKEGRKISILHMDLVQTIYKLG